MSSFRSALLATLCAAAPLAPLRATLDLNRDGISDIWAAAHPAIGVPYADPDGDGATNRDEALAGTDPSSAASRFVATPQLDSGGNLALRWRGEPGKRYHLESTADLDTWTGTPEEFTGTGAELSATVRTDGATGPAARFWRVVVQNADTDGDGLDDWEESRLSTSPTEKDTDHDGLPDAWEVAFGLDPLAADASADPDHDGFTNAQEYAVGSDPTAAAILAQLPDTIDQFPGIGPTPTFWHDDWFVQNWDACRAGYRANRATDHGKTVLLGDSITQFWWTSADAFAFPTANRGIMGDFTRGVLYRLQTDVLDFDPPAISILIGTNDLSFATPPETIATNIATILDRIEAWTQTRMMAGKPRVAVVINLIMPRGSAADDFRPAIAELNRRIVALAKDRPRTAVCDTFHLYAGADGLPDPIEFPDLLHPIGEVYPCWHDAIVAAFATLGYPQ